MSLLPEISQASAEINKFVAQANIHQTIAPVDPAAFTDPADTVLLASRDPVIREVSVGMTGEAYSDYSVSGTPPLSLPNSLGKPLKAWSVDVLPKQDLNGYDAPWPAGGGVNVLDPNIKFTAGTYYGLTFSTTDGYNYSYSGTATGSGNITTNSIATSDAVILPAGTYISTAGTLSLYSTSGSWLRNQYSNVAFTMTEPFFVKNIYLEIVSGQEYNNTVFSSLAKGSTAPSSWSPYSNICPIHGTDKLNMFVEESYDQSATPKAVLTLPQTVYTGTIGSEGGESRQRKRVLNGSENWTGSNTSGIYMELSGMKKFVDYDVSNRMFCENLSVAKNNNNMSDFSITGYADYTSMYPNQNWLYIRIDDNHPDASSVKQWLAENPVTVVYDIAEPDQLSLTVPLIPTPKGTATTWATAEDGTVDSMEVTYVGKA